MKQVTISLIAVLLSCSSLYAQCNPYYIFEEGSSWELTSYNAKDKLTGRQVHELKSLEEMSDGWRAEK